MPSRSLTRMPNAKLLSLRPSTQYICPSCRRTSLRAIPYGNWLTKAFAREFQGLASVPRTTSRDDASRSPKFGRKCLTFQTRRNSTSSTTPVPRPTTSVNAASKVSPALSNLYDALREIERFAANYVNLGRLKLAIRSLETGSVTRIGVLALTNGSTGATAAQQKARDLVGALLADVLSDKQSWESALESSDPRAILIQPGSTLEAKDTNSVFRRIHVESPLLKKHNVEILVSTVDIDVTRTQVDNVRNTQQDGLLDLILVPRLETAASSAGGYSTVGYPIHKALLIGQSTGDILALGLYASAAGTSTLPLNLVQLAIDNPQLAQAHHATVDSTLTRPTDRAASITSAIDISEAKGAVQSFRSSIANATLYQHKWDASNVGNISKWIADERQQGTAWSAALKTYIADLLDTTSARIESREAELEVQSKPSSMTDAERDSINNAVGVWAEAAHRELRDSLDLAFASRQWRKLKWWKLSWRVDEVSLFLEDVLERSWLTGAEKGVVFLAGRVQETELLQRKAWESSVQSIEPTRFQPGNGGSSAGLHGVLQTPSSSPAVLVSNPPDKAQAIPFAELEIPYPQHIPAARRALLSSTVPDMHALAQRLVLTNLSTTALTSALSALYYVSFPLTTLYEAGAFAALGLVFGLKRMQSRWQDAQEDWQAAVRDEGRRALLGTEASLRAIVKRGGQPVVDDVLLREIDNAKLLIAEARLALHSIEIKV